jgi:hypothetical protein
MRDTRGAKGVHRRGRGGGRRRHGRRLERLRQTGE